MSTIRFSRRRFLSATGGVAAAAAGSRLHHGLLSQADVLSQVRKSAILLWMGGGPSTIDIWDLKPGTEHGGPFQPIATNGDVQICEHLPRLAQHMDRLAIVRSMSTREEDHRRGSYYMHTGFMPADVTRHPSYGAIIAKETASQRPRLELPPYVTVATGSGGAGYLGPEWAPFHVSPEGKFVDLPASEDDARLAQRMAALSALEQVFDRRDRGVDAESHMTAVENTVKMLRSEQRRAFEVMNEPIKTLTRYGLTDFGKGCLMARRLIEAGVPFIEVGFPGWDNHANIFPELQDRLLPQMDQAMSALLEDLDERSLLRNTAIIWMGEFGRSPRVNNSGGRDHWAKAWSVVLGGAGIVGGRAIGETSDDGTQVESEPYSAEDVLATVLSALGISLETTYKTRFGRELNIANGGRVIEGLGIASGKPAPEKRGRELIDLIDETEPRGQDSAP